MGEAERFIDKWRACFARLRDGPPRVFADLIALHVDDLTEVGKPIRRSKLAVMNALKVSLGRVKIQDLTRERSELCKAQAPTLAHLSVPLYLMPRRFTGSRYRLTVCGWPESRSCI